MATPPKGRADYYESGDWNASCSMCGRKRKASTLEKNWQGQYRCPEHNEPRNPQDFVRATADVQTVPWSQPASDQFAGVCFPNGRTAIAGFSVSGCWITGFTDPLFDPTVKV